MSRPNFSNDRLCLLVRLLSSASVDYQRQSRCREVTDTLCYDPQLNAYVEDMSTGSAELVISACLIRWIDIAAHLSCSKLCATDAMHGKGQPTQCDCLCLRSTMTQKTHIFGLACHVEHCYILLASLAKATARKDAPELFSRYQQFRISCSKSSHQSINPVRTTLGKAAAVVGSQSHERQTAPRRREGGLCKLLVKALVLKDAAICGAASAGPQLAGSAVTGPLLHLPRLCLLAITDRTCVVDFDVLGVS